MAREIPENEMIQFIGVNELDPMEQDTVNRLSTEYFGKIKRAVKNLTSMKVHVKTYEKEGGKKKFSMHVQVLFPGGTVESTKANDFELARALHKAFEDVRQQISHRFHADATSQK